MSERLSNPEQGILLPEEPTPFPEELVATADASVDTVVESLLTVPESEVSEHPEMYQRIHDELAAELQRDAE